MYVRVVRFTDVSGARMQQLTTRVKQAGGPPPGVSSTGLTVLFDEAQRTAVVLQRFATAEAQAFKKLGAMVEGAAIASKQLWGRA